MRLKAIKKVVKELQRNLAEYDFALGKPARKNSKTYREHYGRLYAEAESKSAQDYLELAYF
jgi:hypothetical protein